MAAIGKGSGKAPIKRGGAPVRTPTNLKTGVHLPSTPNVPRAATPGQFKPTGRTGIGGQQNTPGTPGKA